MKFRRLLYAVYVFFRWGNIATRRYILLFTVSAISPHGAICDFIFSLSIYI